MLNRALNKRELEILHMIRPTTWRDIVDEVRKDFENNRFNARKLIKNLRNNIDDLQQEDVINRDIIIGSVNEINKIRC